MSQCRSQRIVWGYESGGSSICCRLGYNHPGAHKADWIDSVVMWDHLPQCSAWNPQREGESHRVCLLHEGHEGPHGSFDKKDLKVAWWEDARPLAFKMAQALLPPRYDFYDDLASPTAQKLYAPTDVQQAVWAFEGKAQEKILAREWERAWESRRADQTALGSPRTYAERKARRKGK